MVQSKLFRAVKPSACTINMANVIPSCRNADIDDDLDLTDALNGRLAEILTNDKNYSSLVGLVNSFRYPSPFPLPYIQLRSNLASIRADWVFV